MFSRVSSLQLDWAGGCRNWSFCGLLVCDLQLVADLSQPSPASSPTQVSKLGPTGDPSPTFYILCTEFSFWECTYHVPIPPLLYCATRKAWYRPRIWSNVAIMTHFFANNEYRRWSWAGSRGTSRTWELCRAARADIIHTWPGRRLYKTKKHNLTFPWHRDVLPLLLWGLPDDGEGENRYSSKMIFFMFPYLCFRLILSYFENFSLLTT